MRPPVTPMMYGPAEKRDLHARRRTMHGHVPSGGHRDRVIEQKVTNGNGPTGTASGSSSRNGLNERSTNGGRSNMRVRSTPPIR